MNDGQLHQISAAIGELKGAVDAINRRLDRDEASRSRIHDRLDEQSHQLEETNRRLAAIEMIVEAVEKLKADLGSLFELKNMGRGAFVALAVLAAGLGLVVSESWKLLKFKLGLG